MIDDPGVQVIKFAFVVMCLAHWQACAWYLMHILQNKGEGGTTWVELLAQNFEAASLDENSRWSQYITCIYWAITTMTTIGYGKAQSKSTHSFTCAPHTLSRFFSLRVRGYLQKRKKRNNTRR